MSVGLKKMIEAVKSTIAASAALKSGLEQSSPARAFAADPGMTASTPAAPYVSPTVRVDVNTKVAILEFKESDTGEVIMQVPSERQLSAYKEQEVREKAEILAKLSRRPDLGVGAGAAKVQSDAPIVPSSNGESGQSVDFEIPQASVETSSAKVSVSTTGIEA